MSCHVPIRPPHSIPLSIEINFKGYLISRCTCMQHAFYNAHEIKKSIVIKRTKNYDPGKIDFLDRFLYLLDQN